MEYTETEKRSLAVACGVIVFTVVAVLAFIYTGGGVIFYTIALVTIALEFYMAYRISQEGQPVQKKPAKRARK
jgi:4-hydroxybenzoate polyprenyltransferase